MPYAVDDIVEDYHSTSSDEANCTGNQQYSCLWLIAVRARRPDYCICGRCLTSSIYSIRGDVSNVCEGITQDSKSLKQEP